MCNGPQHLKKLNDQRRTPVGHPDPRDDPDVWGTGKHLPPPGIRFSNPQRVTLQTELSSLQTLNYGISLLSPLDESSAQLTLT
jgi:hypothetical protein